MFESGRRLLRALLLLTVSTIPIAAHADGPGGILENINNAQARPHPTASEIAAFLPSRGKFTFPSPWNTTGYRITNPSDCGGTDCVDYVGYSYWRNMNNSVGSQTMLIMVGLNRAKGGQGPTLFQLDKSTGAVTKLGPIFDSSSILSWTTGEGFYFSYSQPHKLWVTWQTQMMLYDVITHQSKVVFDVMQYLKNVDIATASPAIANLADSVRAGSSYILWQSHTSNDDLAHSATLETPNGAHLGCIVFRDDTGAVSYFPAKQALDECQIGRGGRWLVIKEGLDNRIIDLANNNSERLLLDKQGAPGHSDMGVGYMIGEDNQAAQANTFRLWDMASLTNVVTYYNYNWYAPAPNHISFTNARSDIPIGQQHACGDSMSSQTTPDVNEIVCFNLNNSGNVMVAAPVMTDPNASGGGSDYNMRPKGNMDPTGQYFIWTSNMGTSRLDAFVVSLPTHLLNDPTIANGSAGSIQPQNIGTSGSTSTSSSSSGTSTSTSGGTTTVTDTTPPVIQATNATATDTSATVTWTTDEASDSQVDYGLTSNYGSSTSLDANLSTSHNQTLSGLQAGTTYHYRVKSRDAAGNLAVSGDMTFTTATPPDTTPPTISLNGPLVGTSSATISWLTNEASDSQVQYGTTTAYGTSTKLDPTLTTNHNQTLSNLQASTTYHYRVMSRDAAGNLATSADQTLTTAAATLKSTSGSSSSSSTGIDTTPPTISQVSTTAGTTTATVNWATDEASDSQVEYGLTTSYGTSTALDGNPVTSHSQSLASLTPATTYHYRVRSTDAAGNTAISGDQTFTTSADTSTSSTGTTSTGVSDVSWQNPVNVTVNGNSLQKTSGCDGCPDASAASSAQISASGGYLEFTANETGQLRIAGLANTDVGSSYTLINFAIRLQQGDAAVRENGVYMTDVRFASGDTFRINVNNGVVTYLKNGNVFYTSRVKASGQLTANAVLFDTNATIGNARLSQTSGSTTNTTASTSTTTTSTSTWSSWRWHHHTQLP